MPLQKKSELKAIDIAFDPAGKLMVLIQWAEGAWDTDTGAWHGAPNYTTQPLSEAVNGDKDMTRFTSALGVLHAEVVKQNAALQEANESLREAYKLKGEENRSQQDRIAELLAANKLVKGEAEAARASRNSVLKENVELATQRLLDSQRYRSWLYRLTMGFFGR